MFPQKGRISRDGAFQVGVLDGLDQAQVPFGQGQVTAARQYTQNRQAGPLHPQPGQAFVPRACAPVQDDARKGQVGVVHAKPKRRCRSRLRLSAHIQHQHDGPPHAQRRLGAGPVAQFAGLGDAVEQAH